jgi:DNA-binding response OmpR family regulator
MKKNDIKRLRQCKNINLLVVSGDSEFKLEIESSFGLDVRDLKIANTKNKALELCSAIPFDVVIFDSKCDNFKNFFKKMDELSAIPLRILITDTYEEEDMLDAVNSNIYTVLTRPFNIANLKLAMIMAINQSKRSDKIKLGNGFYYDIYRNKVYNKHSKDVGLTNLEIELLKLLIENWGEIVSYESIKTHVWKGKKMSIFTMRNVVNKLRKKTYYDIFRNDSSKGYKIY